MAQLFEFFFNLFMTVWNNIDGLITPIIDFLGTFTEFAISAITNALAWLLSALEWIIDLFKKLAAFFGADENVWDGGIVGGGHGGGGSGGR